MNLSTEIIREQALPIVNEYQPIADNLIFNVGLENEMLVENTLIAQAETINKLAEKCKQTDIWKNEYKDQGEEFIECISKIQNEPNVYKVYAAYMHLVERVNHYFFHDFIRVGPTIVLNIPLLDYFIQKAIKEKE